MYAIIYSRQSHYELLRLGQTESYNVNEMRRVVQEFTRDIRAGRFIIDGVTMGLDARIKVVGDNGKTFSWSVSQGWAEGDIRLTLNGNADRAYLRSLR